MLSSREFTLSLLCIFWFLCSVVLTIVSVCSIIQLAGPCFRVIMEFSSFYLTPRRRFKYSDDGKF